MQTGLELTRHVGLLALAVLCVYTDLARGKLYNWITYGGLALGLSTAYILDAYNPGYHHITAAALAAAVGGGILFLIYLTGGLGAGDVKFMAAVGALSPYIRDRIGSLGFMMVALMYAALVGAGIALAVLIWKRRLLQGLRDSLRTLFTFRAPKSDSAISLTIPYGVAIGIGVMWAWAEVVL